jgi:hypothetical protein
MRASTPKHLVSTQQKENNDADNARREAGMQDVSNSVAVRQQLQKQEKSLHNTRSFRKMHQIKLQPMTIPRACGESTAAGAERYTTRKQWR